MGVTDCHVHVNPLEQMRPEALRLLGPIDPERRRLLAEPERFLEYLDRCGVERAVLVNYVAPEVIGYTEAANDFVAAYAMDHRDRLVAVGGLRPDHPDPGREVRRLVREVGLRGIKLHPSHQLFAPNEYVDGRRPGLKALYAACEAERVPVIVHTGTSVFPGARNRYADPMLVEDVAVDFPDLTIVLAHGGRPFWTGAAMFLARRFPNVWLELSGIPPQNLLTYFPQLPRLAHKAIFGTDWPGPGVRDIRANLEGFRAIGLADVETAMILEENPRRVFPP